VDDEPHIGLLLRPHFERHGYRVTLARTLAAAREALVSDSALPDGVLLDLHLPDGSGLDLLRELRGSARTRALPVVVLTAEGEERVLAEAEQLGAALLTKPFSPTKLTARIAAMLGDAPPAPTDESA
jgi:DNA-binding response OmpR family regulator